MKGFALPVLAKPTPEAELGNQEAFGGLESPQPRDLKSFDEGPGAQECLPVLRACLAALRRYPQTREGYLVPVDALSPAAVKVLDETLGEGEVSLEVGGRHRYEARETVLPGLWRVTTKDGAQVVSRHLEVGDVPSVVRAAEETATHADIHIGNPPEGAMNALPVLAELRHRSQAWQPGQPNHVLSFTLLPMNEADMAYLEQQVGHGPVRGQSKGFSTCKVELTAVRHVWAVQHFNAMDRLVLDTLEVGDVPEALRAAGHDFEDSADRLAEWLGHAAT